MAKAFYMWQIIVPFSMRQEGKTDIACVTVDVAAHTKKDAMLATRILLGRDIRADISAAIVTRISGPY